MKSIAPAGRVAAALLVFNLCAARADDTNRPLSDTDLFPNPVVARGTGFEVRNSDVEDAVTNFKATLASQGQQFPENQRAEFAARALDRLILQRILLQKATPEDRAKAKETADKFIAETKKNARSAAAYERRLLAAGIKPDVFERRAFEQSLAETVVGRELRDKITVAPEAVRAFYDRGQDVPTRDLQALVDKMEKDGQTKTKFYTDGTNRLAELSKANLDRLERPESVRASLILLYTVDMVTHEPLPPEVEAAKKVRIEKALARLKDGEDFGKVAREVSDDPDVARSGGEYSTTRDNVALPELKAALFSLPIGQLSGIVTTPLGFYIIKVAERNPAGKIPFDKAEKEIQTLLVNQEVEKRMPAYYEQLKKDFAVQILPRDNAKP
jgi:parvulin-like peptidyl-prolyl isomerase